LPRFCRKTARRTWLCASRLHVKKLFKSDTFKGSLLHIIVTLGNISYFAPISACSAKLLLLLILAFN
jgi:hypothetical protein